MFSQSHCSISINLYLFHTKYMLAKLRRAHLASMSRYRFIYLFVWYWLMEGHLLPACTKKNTFAAWSLGLFWLLYAIWKTNFFVVKSHLAFHFLTVELRDVARLLQIITILRMHVWIAHLLYINWMDAAFSIPFLLGFNWYRMFQYPLSDYLPSINRQWDREKL